MPESIHDIALKLGLLNDVGSFKEGERLMKDFTDAALANQRRVKEAATDLSGTDKFLHDPAKNILKKSQIESLKQADLFALDDKLQQGTISRQEYNKTLQDTVVRWEEIEQAQQKNTISLQKQQALQSTGIELTEDEINRQKELKVLKDDITKRNQHFNTSIKETEGFIKRTNALLGTYANMTDRVAEDIDHLTLALQRNIITQQQFNSASAIAHQRLNAVRGGTGNAIFAIGELGRGLEDFVTVMSITGFGIQGFGMGMRGASNNISQATMLMAGNSGALIGSFAGISAIAIGQLVPYLFKTAKTVDEVSLAFERNKRAIDNTADSMNRLLNIKFRLEDTSRIQSSSEARNIFTSTNPREIERTRTELAKLSQENVAAQIKMSDSVVGPGMLGTINATVNAMKNDSREIAKTAATELQDIMVRYRQAIISGNKEAIETSIKDLSLAARFYKQSLGELGLERQDPNVLKGLNAIEKGAKAGEAFLADKEKMHELQENITEASNKELAAKQQLAALEEQALVAKEKYFQLLEKEDLMRDNASERDARILEQQSQFRLHKELDKDIRGNISEESFLKDLSIRYRDLMAVPWMTEGSKEALDNSFRNELFTRESELERDLFLKQPDLEVGTSTVTEAVTNANKQMMDAQNDDKFTQQLNELKAIKKALEGNLFPVERIQ